MFYELNDSENNWQQGECKKKKTDREACHLYYFCWEIYWYVINAVILRLFNVTDWVNKMNKP